MKTWIRRWRLIVTLVVLGGAGALLAYGWPFLTYPVTALTFERPAPLPAQPLAGPMAGVAERDITAPIGTPKFGYSAFARDADGFRTRLKARAFYLHAPGQTPLALVQLDLGTGSLALHDRVAELIAAHTDIPAHALSLLVTHTHSGPGNYLGSDFYNVFGSNRAGFDPELFDFLSRQIAAAVIAAYDARRPAKFAVGQEDVWGLTRNRSLAAWAQNFNIPDDQLNAALALRAVNPRMTMLRIDLQSDSGCFYPAGALTLFSIHGTAIPAFRGEQNADVWAWMSRNVAQQIDAHPGNCKAAAPFVHGTAQATHADNSPNIVNSQRGDREARRIGSALAAHAMTLFNTLTPTLSEKLDTAVASRELDLLDQVQPNQYGLCERPIIGASVAGAANGDEVFPLSYLPYFKEDWPRSVFTDGCQGVKQWMISKLQLLLPASRFPHRALLQVVRINDLVIVPMPWEVTLESGNQIRDAVRATLPDKHWKVEISSLANGYFGYAVTAKEYQRQFYEGGHTLYGPHTVDFLAGESARLSHDLFNRGDIADLPARSQFSLLSHEYWPASSPADTGALRKQLQAPHYVAATETHESYWAFRYRDVLPGSLALNQPLLSVQDLSGVTPTTIASDAQTDLRILLIDTDGNHGSYEVRWYNPRVGLTQAQFRFHIAARDNQPALESSAF